MKSMEKMEKIGVLYGLKRGDREYEAILVNMLSYAGAESLTYILYDLKMAQPNGTQ
jgi:hypothetical protein